MRLRPGGLDLLVLEFVSSHGKVAPAAVTTVAVAHRRSSGAVGTCLSIGYTLNAAARGIELEKLDESAVHRIAPYLTGRGIRSAYLIPGDIYIEEHGLPLHGLRSAVSGWSVVSSGDTRLVAAREFAGVAEFPFAPSGWPARLEGRSAIEDYVRDYAKTLDIKAFPKKVVHRTTDPDVAIVEFDAEGVVVPTGEPYRSSYIVVITTRDGEIVNYRDYWNPLQLQEWRA